jgi:Zn-dependent M28 family amino/carboxypeptidase
MRVAHGWQTRPQRFIIAAVTHFCQQSSSNGGDMRRLNLTGLLLVALLLTLPLQAPYAQQSSVRAAASAAAPSAYFDAERAAADRITADEMKEILYYIASDKMLGRDTPSAGLDATAKYIADRLAKYKYKPMGDNGTYFQHIALSKTAVDRENTNAQFGDKTYKVGEDILPMGRASGDVEGQLVYAGQGWVVNSKNINPYAGLDVKDKIVVVSGNGVAPPQGISVDNLPASDWESPVSYAQKHGAKALVLVPRNFDRIWQFAPRFLSRAAYSVTRFQDAAAGGATPNTLVEIVPSRAMLDALFAGEQTDGASILKASTSGEELKGFALSPSKRLRVSVKLDVQEASTQNVVAVLEGKDPVLKNEYVALGAHYDHVGTNNPGCRPVGDDNICNGADDDGSGTTSLITMAEAFAKGPRPKRSILFVWHAGEEKGLWGSDYFTRFPTVPLKQVVAQLNIDMIGRSRKPGDTNPANKMLTGPDEIYVIGSRMMSDQLADENEAVNKAYLNIKYNYHYDEPNDPERLFYRSDHFNYAKHGVPIIFFFDGVHEDYHRPTDSPDKIDYVKMQNVARTIFILASELANAPNRPAIDKQIPADRLNG